MRKWGKDTLHNVQWTNILGSESELQFIFSSVERHSVPYYYINITTEPQKPVTGVKGRFLRVLLAILPLLP